MKLKIYLKPQDGKHSLSVPPNGMICDGRRGSVEWDDHKKGGSLDPKDIRRGSADWDSERDKQKTGSLDPKDIRRGSMDWDSKPMRKKWGSMEWDPKEINRRRSIEWEAKRRRKSRDWDADRRGLLFSMGISFSLPHLSFPLTF